MNRGFSRTPGRARFRFFVVFLIFLGFIAGKPAPAGNHPSSPEPVSCEPRPPLDLNLEVTGFLPSPPGGIATIRVAIQPFTEIGQVTISSRLRQEMQFLDGSTEKSWLLTVPRGASAEFTEEILVPDDGLFVVVLEADAVTASGRPLHRSQGLKIWSGISPPQPRKRGQVLEFPGEPLP